MAVMQTSQQPNTISNRDWLERTKDMVILAYIEPGDFRLASNEEQEDFTKVDFEEALKKVSRKIKK